MRLNTKQICGQKAIRITPKMWVEKYENEKLKINLENE